MLPDAASADVIGTLAILFGAIIESFASGLRVDSNYGMADCTPPSLQLEFHPAISHTEYPNHPITGEPCNMSINPQSVNDSQRISLHHIPWEIYVSLTEVLSDISAPRMAYYAGTLEFMAPTSLHEQIHRLFADIVDAIAESRDIDVVHTVSTTFQHADVEAGIEADESFYIEHAAAISPSQGIDLDRDPPPDLVVEVDITNSSMRKLPLVAALRIPEVWRYTASQVEIHVLADGVYQAAAERRSFPDISHDFLKQLISQGQVQTRRQWLRYLRGIRWE